MIHLKSLYCRIIEDVIDKVVLHGKIDLPAVNVGPNDLVMTNEDETDTMLIEDGERALESSLATNKHHSSLFKPIFDRLITLITNGSLHQLLLGA